MNDVFFARSQVGMSLAFHIIFAVIGMAMPLLMAVSQGCYLWTGFIALETGWFVTELGRQRWIIYGFMRTKEAVTPMPGLVVPFTTFTIVYLMLAVIVIFLLRRQFLETQPRWIKKEPVLQQTPTTPKTASR